MNHTPHILASVFLCGLWLPIWIILALSHQDAWRCAFCGYSDAVKYLQNPGLREQEQVFAQQKQVVDQKRAAEHAVLVAAMPYESASDKARYHWAAHRTPLIVGAGVVTLIGFFIVSSIVNTINRKTYLSSNDTNSTQVELSKTANAVANAANAMANAANSRVPASPPAKSADYKAGYGKGYKEGRSWAMEVVGGGMPTPQGIRMMATYQASESGSKDASSWADGWYEGFGDGYQGIKPAKIESSSLQPVSLANAKPGVKLFDHQGNFQVTIVSVDQADGIIRVKYPSSRGGVTEDKNLSSLSNFWFVKVK